MGTMTNADVTVTVNPQDRHILGKLRANFGTIRFGDLTNKDYPASGIPLPAIGSFGFNKELTFMSIQQPHADGRIYKYDQTNHKIRIYRQTIDLTDGAGGTAVTAHAGVLKANLTADAVDVPQDLKEIATDLTLGDTSFKFFAWGK